MPWYDVLFAWPAGAVWGNWVDDVVCLLIGAVAGRYLTGKIKAHVADELGRLHHKIDEHHEQNVLLHEQTRRHVRTGAEVDTITATPAPSSPPDAEETR